jgi:hypothetical protein
LLENPTRHDQHDIAEVEGTWPNLLFEITNVLLALMRHSADRQVVDGLDKQPRSSICTTLVTILEIRFGLQILPVGKRRSLWIQSFEKASSTKSRGELLLLTRAQRSELLI